MKIGRYELESEIGRGGMGVVYLAFDPSLKRQVAIKTFRLPDELSVDRKQEVQERFQREGQAAARLLHPGIVTVFDTAEDEATGDPYIAMEYIEGRTLRAYMDQVGRLPAPRALRIAGILAEALDSAHMAGIVHRDVKPGNVIVRSADDEVKIADFGVARLPTSELTATGMTVGSPAYMSPEHITSGHVDARSDLFSLAVILYEMLCGERPFHGEELPSLAYSIAHEDPVPVTQRVEGLPAAIDEFFERALAKDPAARFPSGREFAEALSAVESVPTNEGHDEPKAPRSRTGRWALAVGFVVALLFGVNWVWGGRATVVLEGRSSVQAGSLTLTVDGREVFTRDLTADRSEGDRLLETFVGMKPEEFSTSIAMAPGMHEFVAHLQTENDGRRHRETLVIAVERGDRRTLYLSAGGAHGTPLSLKMD